jgi:hypothetical protein
MILAALSMQEPGAGSGDLLFLLGGAVIALIVFGYLLIRRSRQYPVDSPYSTRTSDSESSDEEEVETFL